MRSQFAIRIVNLSEQRELGRGLRADRIFDDLAVNRRHRNSDRHLIQCKLQRALFGDPIVANDRRYEPARIGMAVDRRDGGSWISKET